MKDSKTASVEQIAKLTNISKTFDKVEGKSGLKEAPSYGDIDFKGLETGYIPLGYLKDQNIVFSKYRSSLFVLKATDFNKSAILNNFGLDFLETYSFLDEKGKKAYNTLKLQDDMVRSCIERGMFDQGNVKEGGIFVDPNNKDFLIFNGSDIWSTNPSFNNSRVQKRVVYTVDKMFLDKDTECASLDDISRVNGLLNSWNFSNGDVDRKLVLGWMLCAFLCGSLDWRTHAYATGEAGSGKSTLLKVMSNMLSDFGEWFDGALTSEPGIRQAIGCSYRSVLIDESEPSGKSNVDQLLAMLRASSSGSKVNKGTADQKGIVFKLNYAGFLASIVPPKFEQADESRFLKFQIKERDKNKTSLDISDVDFHREVGKKMLMIIFKNFVKFQMIKKIVWSTLSKKGKDDRFCDTYSSVITASCMITKLWDGQKVVGFTTKDIEDYVSIFECVTKEEKKVIVKDEEDLLNSLLGSFISSEYIRRESILTHILANVGDYQYSENEKVKVSEVKSLLGQYGIKAMKEADDTYVYFDCSDTNLRKVLRGTKFEKGDFKTVLSRVKTSVEFKGEISIGNKRRNRSNLIKIKLDSSIYNNEENLSYELEKEAIINNSKEKVEHNGDFVDFGISTFELF